MGCATRLIRGSGAADIVMRLLLIHTGGTIGMAKTKIGFAPQSGVVEAAVAGLSSAAQITVTSLTPLIDSANATWADWNRIAQTIAQAHDEYDGFIVTHGTDTLAFTTAALCFALQGLNRPVILTGAMTPLGLPDSDGLRNLTDAVAAAQTALPGIWVQFAGRLLHGARIRKADSHADAAFAASACNQPPLHPGAVLVRHDFAAAEIAMLSVTPGASRTLAAAIEVCDGAVLRVFGAGTVPNDPVLAGALHDAQRRGIPIIAVSQCAQGGIHLGTYAAGNLLVLTGVIDGNSMTPEAAFAKLTHVLSRPVAERASALRRSLCGED